MGHYLQDNLLVAEEFLEVVVAEYQLKWAVQSINIYWQRFLHMETDRTFIHTAVKTWNELQRLWLEWSMMKDSSHLKTVLITIF